MEDGYLNCKHMMDPRLSNGKLKQQDGENNGLM